MKMVLKPPKQFSQLIVHTPQLTQQYSCKTVIVGDHLD